MKENFSGRRVLITGGLGFIGSNLARRLAEGGARVHLVDCLVPEYGGNLFNIQGMEEKIRITRSDVGEPSIIEEAVRDQDYLFNLVGQTSHWDSMENPFPDLENNMRSQLVLLQACRRYNPAVKIVFASTRQIYGRPEYLPVDEKHPLNPVDINGIHKMAAEQYHLLYHRVWGLRTCALRLTNTYGPRMRVKDSRQTFLGEWIRSLIEGRPFEVWDGSQRRDFTYVEDAVDAFLAAAKKKETEGKVLNVGGDCNIPLKALAEMLVEVHGSGKFTMRAFPEERRSIDIGDYYADSTQIQSLLGWRPRTLLKEGLKRTLSFYRENLTHYL